ncbi:hypothetical protein CAPTEDRAFT_182026 [Capitella teleta]|uniref:WD repeat-containing protein 46 n=1 Tax=Capitella teleta TaxID=283909 RepID=R7VC18_CAPTE|nr:hypothetical protein CAPTEDRAFT_182026 [Capitella teleta]|eukprot:ELU16393.1 hypothetical protein CAPTEDRAFT_182026 [Capitella teleta]
MRKRKKDGKGYMDVTKRAKVGTGKLHKYKRGELNKGGIINKYDRVKFNQQSAKYQMASKQAARAEALLQEEAGFIEADEGESTCEVTQYDIANAVDITSAQKFFELKLDKFGPYRVDYSRNGRFMLMGGAKGHVAAFDWQTKNLMCEINVMETVKDVKWLHQETMFAAAQKQWLYIYDNQGVELHCIDVMNNILKMEFLPYHFLLATSSSYGRLTYLDVSIGKRVSCINTNHGRLDVMCQNPSNAIIHLGHSGGTVTLWSPNSQKPLVKMLCHGVGTRAIAVDNSGNFMATAGIDRTLKIWDLRTYKALHSYKVSAGPGSLAFSQRGLLAAGMGNIVEVYRDITKSQITAPYMMHSLSSPVANVQYCPYEDVLGVGHAEGFSSLLIPGSGEPNFDALEANPYQSKKQRQQAEVNMLLEKIQPEMITLDSRDVGKVDVKTLQEQIAEREKIIYLKPEKIEFTPRKRMKGKSKTGNLLRRVEIVKGRQLREEVQSISKQKEKLAKMLQAENTDGAAEVKEEKPFNVFDRFKRKEQA